MGVDVDTRVEQGPAAEALVSVADAVERRSPGGR